MARRTLGLSITFLTMNLLTPCFAQAQTTLWHKHGFWEIRLDKTINDSCFVTATGERGTSIRFGINKNRNRQGYMLVGNKNWGTLQGGQDYEIQFRFDDSTLWKAPARAVRLDGYNHLLFYFDKQEIFLDFIRRNWIYMYIKGQLITSISMKGSSVAFNEMVRCQKNADGSPIQPSPSRRENPMDPFKQ
jgi:serine protease Do